MGSGNIPILFLYVCISFLWSFGFPCEFLNDYLSFYKKKKKKNTASNMIGNVSLLYMNLKNTDSFITLGIPSVNMKCPSWTNTHKGTHLHESVEKLK